MTIPPTSSKGLHLRSTTPTSKRPCSGGFSLVEVTLAMGVVTVALTTMVGAMTVGLTTVREASDDTMHAQITSQVSSNVLQTKFADLKALSDQGELYFDESGRQVEKKGESIYRVKLELVPGSDKAYPGAPADLDSSAKMMRINVSTMPPTAEAAVTISHSSILVSQS